MDSETDISADHIAAKSGLVFRGRVPHESAVSVRGNDGLFRYAWLIRKEEDGFLVDFRCGPERMQIVPFGMVFYLEGVFSAWHEVDGAAPECIIRTVLEENARVEVLLQSQLDEPWTWHPGTLVAADFQKGIFGHVSLSSTSTRTGTVIVPGQQIRLRSNESELEHSIISNTDPVSCVVHYPLPLDCCNHVPRELLAEVFDCLPTNQQTRMRRVCSLWGDIVAGTLGMVVNVASRLSKPCYWHILWKPTTRVLVIEPGSESVGSVARLLKRIKDEYGYPQLAGIGLRGVVIYERNFDIFCERLSDLRDQLALFESTCRFVKLIDPKLECQSSSDYSVQCEVIHTKWTDVSAPGFSDRFRTSLSVHYNPDIDDELPDLWMREQIKDVIGQSSKAMYPVNDRLASKSMKHSGMPCASSTCSGSEVAIRGDDGLLHYARTIAKETNGLLVDFCDGKPLMFVPFGKIYDYPYSNYWPKKPVYDTVDVLLQLKADEPWKWYPGNVLAVTGSALGDFLLGFVTVSVATGAPLTLVAPSQQIWSFCDVAALESRLMKNGDRISAELHRRLDWEMKIDDLPPALLEEVFDRLGVVECCRLRVVCTSWSLSAESATFGTVYLEDAQSSVTCLHNVWNKNVNTVVVKYLEDNFWAVCRLLHRIILQNGSVPLKMLVLKEFNDFPVSYTAGAGLSDELSFLSSVCRCLVFRKAQFRLRLKLGRFNLNLDDQEEESYNKVQVKSGRIDLSSTDYAAQFFQMIADSVEPRDSQIEKIRAYFSQPTRSSECVDGVLEILKDVENAMHGDADDRNSCCSFKHLLTLQLEKLNGLAVAVIAQLIGKYCSKL